MKRAFRVNAASSPLLVPPTLLVVLALAFPSSSSARQLRCAHPAISAAIQPPAIVGIPFKPFGGTFWCLEADDELTEATIAWGDGTLTPGQVSYSKAEAGSVLEGLSFVPVTLKVGYIDGSHAYTHPQIARITFDATDEPGGEALSVPGEGVVVPRDAARGVARRVSLGTFRRVLGHVQVPTGIYISHELQARIDWGEGRTSAGTVVQQARGGSATATFAIHGQHRWLRPGDYTVRVAVSDALGPQHYVIHDQVIVLDTAARAARSTPQTTPRPGPNARGGHRCRGTGIPSNFARAGHLLVCLHSRRAATS